MLINLYTYARALSLDVVLGAMVCCFFLSRLLQVEIPTIVLLGLGFSVWIIYTLDHLWDAYRLPHQAHSFRHRFHQKCFRPLLFSVVVGVVVCIGLALFLPTNVLIWAILIATLVSAYFLMLVFLGKHVSYLKEIVVAVVYALGVFMAPLVLSTQPVEGWLIILFIQFALIALVNLLEFSFFEVAMDKHHNFGSAVTHWGPVISRRVLVAVLITIGLLALAGFYRWADNPMFLRGQLALLTMTICLACIFFLPAFFGKNERFRILGDSIFLFPLFFSI